MPEKKDEVFDTPANVTVSLTKAVGTISLTYAYTCRDLQEGILWLKQLVRELVKGG